MQVTIIESHECIWVAPIQRYVSLAVSEGHIPASRVYHRSLTLAELRLLAVFFDQNQLVIVNERGEWTADFIDYGNQSSSSAKNGRVLANYVSRPDTVFREGPNWRYTGGIVTPVELPASGWVVPGPTGQLYHPSTGTPWRTSPEPDSRAEASNFAYFWRQETGDGLRVVSRECERISRRAFDFAAVYEPDFTHDNCGFRPTFSPEEGS